MIPRHVACAAATLGLAIAPLVASSIRPAGLAAQQRGAAAATPVAQPAGGRGQGRGGGRGGVQVMTLHASWPDGGPIPVRYTQEGSEESPPLEWTGVPDGVVSYVLIVHDVDAATGNGTDDVLHWLVWNIPGTQTTIPGALPRGAQLQNGIRQISATGPNYRGPGAPRSGPAHHYVFELYALDTMVDVPAVGASPPQTRAAVLGSMAGHVRGKAALVGLFRRGQ